MNARLGRVALLVVAAAAAAAAGCATTSSSKGVVVGRPAPDFALPALGGGDVTLAGLKGQVAVVDFWASWCVPCREELPELERLRGEYEPRGVRFVAINIDDDAEVAKEAARGLGITMPVALDGGKKAAEAFSPPTMPTSYVLDRAGTVRFVHEGFAGGADVERFRRELNALLSAQ